MAGRSSWLWLLGLVACVALVLTACGGDEQVGNPEQPRSEQQTQSQTQSEEQSAQPDGDMVQERVLTVTSEDVGAHLEPRSYAAGLPSWLEASEDSMVSSLPGRALAVSGIAFAPSDDSPTEETLWLHVFSDEQEASAADWVKYLASQPPQLASVIVPHHELFDAEFLPSPVVGDASVAIELFHGHSGICLRSELLVFAQGAVLVFLFNSIEITSDAAGSQTSQSDGVIPQQCEIEQAGTRLTDIDAIANLISDRLSTEP